MKRNPLAVTAFVFAGAIVGCSEPPSIIRNPDAGGREGGTGGCSNGQWQCVPGSQMARQCDGRGGFSAQVDCSTQGAGRTCINGIGCAVCTPNMARCKDGDPNTTQQCAPDGTGWVDGQTCDVANGSICRAGVCRGRCDELGSSYLGCEYWPTITTNSALSNGFSFAAVVANPNSYEVNVRIEGGSLTSPRERIIPAGQIAQILLPWVSQLSNNDPRMCAGGECTGRSARVAGGAFRLRSNGPVAVYQFNPLQFQRVPNATRQTDFSFTNDASLLMPQNVLGTQYIAITPVNERFPSALGDGWAGGFISIVGAQNEGTNTVSVKLTAPVQDPANPARSLSGEQTFQVDRGEVIQLVGTAAAGDLTGTIINSSAPIAVFSGHDCARIPTQNPACDHVEEQLFPTTTWGKTYAVTPFRDRPTNVNHLVRIVAQRDGVMLTFDGITTPAACARMLNQGQFCEFQEQRPFQVTGSQPILVAQFMRGLGSGMPQCLCDSETGICPRRPECVSDPAMVLEVPTDQYRADYNFLIPDSYEQNYINVIAPRGSMIMLDGNMLMGTPVNVGSNLVVYYLNLMPGQHRLQTMSPVERVGLKVYGVASFTSYAFPGGLDLAPISPPG
jgi:hypothetical protein